jgi:hypothetical protein
MTLFKLSGATGSSVLLVYDSPAETRLIGKHGVMADVFVL